MAERCTCCQRKYYNPTDPICKECETFKAMIEDLVVRHQEHHDEVVELWAMYALEKAGAPREIFDNGHGLVAEDIPRSAGDMWRRLKRWAPK